MKFSRETSTSDFLLPFIFKEKANLATSGAENAAGCMMLERIHEQFEVASSGSGKTEKLKKILMKNTRKPRVFWQNTSFARQTWDLFHDNEGIL